MENKDYIVLFEAPVIEKTEYRLYYDEKGNVICYSCENLDKKYVVVDSLTFAEGRQDVIVINGKVIKKSIATVSHKYVPSDNGDVICHPLDISVISDLPNDQQWELKVYEL